MLSGFGRGERRGECSNKAAAVCHLCGEITKEGSEPEKHKFSHDLSQVTRRQGLDFSASHKHNQAITEKMLLLAIQRYQYKAEVLASVDYF